MSKKNYLVILPLILMAACTANTPVNTPSASVSPSPVISSPGPEPSVTVSPSSPATPDASPTASPEPSPSVSPSSSSGADNFESAVLNGTVYDESGARLEQIKITVDSFDENINFHSETYTENGVYVVQNVPVGVRVNVTAYKNDNWTSRTQTVILKQNLSGDNRLNVVDFGSPISVNQAGTNNLFFISNAPEVISVSPEPSSFLRHFGNDLKFKLTFNEDVRKELIEDAFQFRYVKSQDNVIPGDGQNGTSNTDGPPYLGDTGQVIIDKDTTGFSLSWDTSPSAEFGRELSFSVSNSSGVLTRSDSNVNYAITLRGNDASVKVEDREGNHALNIGEFFINNKRMKNIPYNIIADKSEPRLEKVELYKNQNSRKIRMIFSEPMNVSGRSNSQATNLNNYILTRNGTVLTPVNPVISYQSPIAVDIDCDLSSFNDNDDILVEVKYNLTDPVGNLFSQGQTNGKPDNKKQGRIED